MTQINNNLDDGRTSTTAQTNLFTTVTRLSPNSFSLNGRLGANVSNYSSGGTVQCLEQGCDFFLFQNQSNNHWRIRPIVDPNTERSCVSERVGAQAYTDASAASGPCRQGLCLDGQSLPGFDHPAADGQPQHLLKSQIDGYAAVGSTAGQIGVGWGWYMVSPTFGSHLPVGQPPRPLFDRRQAC